MTAPKLLAIYLQDHHAGSAVGVSLARRAAGANAGNEYGDELERLAGEIEADKDSLERLMDSLEVGRDRVKDTAGWLGEKAGRLKRNGRWLDYSPLSRQFELEGLLLGVTGKLSMWRALRAVHGDVIEGTNVAELEARADDQRERLERLRLRAARDALASD